MKKEELLKKSQKPADDAMKMHPFYRGKVETGIKCVIRGFDDFAVWYSPGVAAPCIDIRDNPGRVYEHTNKGNTVAVITDGTRVLGLGDIGAEASLPVMEGKALLYKYLGGVDAVPIALDSKDPDVFIETALLLQPAFGGYNLEDIAQPKCFKILNDLRKRARIPVWHDDQQGTATVTLGALINAVEIVGKSLGEIKVAFIGAGAGNVRISKLCFSAGVDPAKAVMCDIEGTLGAFRDDIESDTLSAEKWELCQITNPRNIRGGIPEAMKGADVVIALSRPGPDVILPEWISTMADDPIVFACANPVPEIYPWEATSAGARIVATGRSDFPNQVNNSLGFPGIFRGVLDVRARTITDEMCIAAAGALANIARRKGIHEEYIIPRMDEWDVFPEVASAVGLKAIEQGFAELKLGREELFNMAQKTIALSRDKVHRLMDEGLIPPFE